MSFNSLEAMQDWAAKSGLSAVMVDDTVHLLTPEDLDKELEKLSREMKNKRIGK